MVRNLVKRRLREIGARLLQEHPIGIDVVVRSLPAAAQADWEELVADMDQAFAVAQRRLAARMRERAGADSASGEARA